MKAQARYEYLVLAGVTLLAAALRFYKLGEWSFWIDEIYTINRVAIHVGDGIDQVIRQPLSLVLTKLSMSAFGTSEWAARLPSALIGFLSIPLLYVASKKLFDARVALIAAFLLAISPWHIYWSQNARFYALMMVLYFVAMVLFFVGLERNRPWYLIASLVALWMAMGERLLAAMLLPVLATYLLALKLGLFGKPIGLRTTNLLPFPLLGLALLVYEGYQYATSGDPLLIGWAEHVLETFGGQPIDDPARLLLFIAFSIGTPLMCLAAVGALPQVLARDRAVLFFYLGALVPLALILLVSPVAFAKDRYVFASLPSWIILAAVAMRELMRRFSGHGRLMALAVLLVLVAHAVETNVSYYQINNGNRRDWRGAFELVQARQEPGDVVVATRPELGAYYLQQEVQAMEGIDPQEVVSNGERFWFVTDSESVWVTGEIRPWVERNAELIDVRYLRVPEDVHLRVYLYDPARYRGSDGSSGLTSERTPE